MRVRPARPPDTAPSSSARKAVVAAPPAVEARITADAAGGVGDQRGQPATADDKVAVKNRQMLIAAHNLQLVQQADERAFAALKTPEAVRVAIRKINDEYGKRARESLSTDPEQVSIGQQIGLGIASNDDAERTRRAAINDVLGGVLGDVLGSEAANDFAAAEYAETRRLRIQYRRQWAEELNAKAPRPPGMPRTPH